MSNEEIKLSSLSIKWQELIRRMQRLNFGLIMNLWIENGEPEFDEHTGTVVCYRFPGDNAARPEASLGDFILPAEFSEFVETLSRLHQKRVYKLQIRHGLPFRMEVEDFE